MSRREILTMVGMTAGASVLELTAAYELSRAGYMVQVRECREKAGGRC